MTTSYLVFRWLHIVSVVIAAGSNITFDIWLLRSMRDKALAAFTLRTMRGIVNFITIPVAMLILIFGVAMSSQFPLSIPWHMLGSILFLVLVVLVLGYSLMLNGMIKSAEKEGPGSAHFRSMTKGIIGLGAVIVLDVVFIGFLMVVKPTLWG
jgi:uncharacterized membrane protein